MASVAHGRSSLKYLSPFIPGADKKSADEGNFGRDGFSRSGSYRTVKHAVNSICNRTKGQLYEGKNE